MSNFIQAPLNKQRKDKYIMTFPIPKGLKAIVSTPEDGNRSNSEILPETFSASIYGTIAPEVVVPATEIRYSGQTYNASSHARQPYAPQVINFTIDNRFNNYWMIYKWLSILNDDKLSEFDADNVTNLTHINEKAAQFYMTDISIYALDEYNKRVIEFKYTNAFPTRLGGINFNDRDSTEAESTMEFAYSQFIARLVEQVENL